MSYLFYGKQKKRTAQNALKKKTLVLLETAESAPRTPSTAKTGCKGGHVKDVGAHAPRRSLERGKAWGRGLLSLGAAGPRPPAGRRLGRGGVRPLPGAGQVGARDGWCGVGGGGGGGGGGGAVDAPALLGSGAGRDGRRLRTRVHRVPYVTVRPRTQSS